MSIGIKKLMVACVAFALVLSSLAACSQPNQQAGGSSSPASGVQSSSAPSSEVSSTPANSVDAVSSAVSSAASSAASSQAASSQQGEEQKALLQNMKKLAATGKVVNIEFAAKTNLIDEVQGKWGKEDKSEYISAAKGTYATYSKHNAVFGFNKGLQLFEVRTFDSAIKKISLSQAKAVLGKPDYQTKTSKDQIIGYVINKDFKILLVFPLGKAGEDPKMDHYSVLYPAGTVNSMADDPGREW